MRSSDLRESPSAPLRPAEGSLFFRGRPWHFLKRWLYLTHRWIGIVGCLLLVMWFLSGFVMLYVPYPSLTQAERLAGQAPIDWRQVHALPSAASDARMLLEQGADGPVWRVRAGKIERSYSATSGALLPPADQAGARRAAIAFGHAPVLGIEAIERDQWTVAGGFDRARPLWKVRLDTPDRRTLYIGGPSGMVVQDTRDWERFWNWLGSVPHWIYPTVLRQDQPLWRQVVIWTSALGIVSAVSGMWIGVLRTRIRRRYKQGRMSPYRGWQYWHHWLGLGGGVLLTTWIVSGWLSVDPGRLFESAGLSDAGRAAYARAGAWPSIDWARAARTPSLAGARQVRLTWSDGVPLLVPERAGATLPPIDARNLMPVQFDAARLRAAAARLVPGAPVVAAERLTAPDNYWYDTSAPPELPVLRVRFGDPARTWVHLSFRTGEVLSDLDTRARTYRWVYSGLHDWDLRGLVNHRPLWDLWMWLWLIPGTIVSISGVVLGYRRLVRKMA